MRELERCRFCNGLAEFTLISAAYGGMNDMTIRFKIRCTGCGVETPKSYTIKQALTKNGAIIRTVDERRAAREYWNGKKAEIK